MSLLQKESICVTGGAGFIGSALVASLVASGNHVTVVDDGSTGNLENVRNKANLVDADISTMSSGDWATVLQGHHTVFHLAAKKLNTPGVSDDDLIAANLTATARMLRAAASANIRKVVFASSLYVYDHSSLDLSSELTRPEPRTLYGTSKLAGEHLLRSLLDGSSVMWAAARLYFVFGPRQYPGSGYKSVIVKNFERILAAEAPQIRGSGTQALDYVFVDDVVRALTLIAEKAKTGSVYNVSSGVATTIASLTEQMLRVAAVETLRPEFIESDWTEGTVRYGSAEKLRRELGWKPLWSLEDGLAATWSDMAQSESS
jgi:UDP-glucose 4-epimerase